MRITDNYIYDTATANINDSYNNIARIQAEISTGIRVDQANKDPGSMAQIMLFQNKLDEISQGEKTASVVKDELSGEQGQLSEYTKIMQKLLTETKKIANGTSSEEDIKQSAENYKQLLSQLITIANSKNTNGDSYFAGTNIKSDAFSVTKNADGEVTAVSYNGNDDHQTVNLSSGVAVNMYQSGGKVFGTGSDSIFSSLIDFIGKLKTGHISSEDTSNEIDTINNFLEKNTQNSTVVANNSSYTDFELSTFQEVRKNISSQLGDRRDADYTKVVTELSQQTTLLKATMSASLKLEKLSMFEEG